MLCSNVTFNRRSPVVGHCVGISLPRVRLHKILQMPSAEYYRDQLCAGTCRMNGSMLPTVASWRPAEQRLRATDTITLSKIDSDIA